MGGYIYRSTDGGATWIEETEAGQRNWFSLAVSSDAAVIVAGVSGAKTEYLFIKK